MKPKTQPNILILMTDQHNPNLMGADNKYGVRTPNIDAIAERGINFSNTYCASPICVASRASLMTGQYVHKHKAWDNGTSIPVTMPTFAHAMTKAGYETVLCARMHYNGLETHHGFEKRLATDVCNPIEYGVPQRLEAPLPQPTYDGVNDAPAEPYNPDPSVLLKYDDYVADKACEYIESNPGKDRPFLLVASFYGPHILMRERPEYAELYEEYNSRDLGGEALTEEEFDALPAHIRRMITGAKSSGKVQPKAHIQRYRADYFSRVTYTDGLIGKVMDSMKSTGLDQDTIIIYLSDHGDQMGEHGICGKSNYFEDTARVPMIVSMPDRKKGSVETNVNLVDVFPTLCDWAGFDDLDFDIDGQSLVPLLEGEMDSRDNMTFSSYYCYAAHRPNYMIKRDQLKYCHYQGEEEFLYDLEKNPEETINFASDPDYAQALEQMRADLANTVDIEAVDAEVTRSFAMRRLIYEAVENGPDTRARLRKHILNFRESWDEPYWDNNIKQGVHEPHLMWEESS